MRSGKSAVSVVGVLVLILASLAGCYRPVAKEAPYVAVVFAPEDITMVDGLVFGTGVTDQLQQVELKLDLFLPPEPVDPTDPEPVDPGDPVDPVDPGDPTDPGPIAPPQPVDPVDPTDPADGAIASRQGGGESAEPTDPPADPEPALARPTLILVHGGGFLFGDRSDFHDEAREWAQRGYVVATPTYRLASKAPEEGFRDVGPGLNAAADGQLAIKWLRANAETYGIDTERIAVIGSSAGGVVALGAGQTVDLTAGRFDGPESHVANAVISTGAPFTPFIEWQLVTSETIGASALIHHYEEDFVTGFTGDETRLTCLVWATEPSPHRCMPLVIEGSGHTLGVGPESFLAERAYHPFLAAELDLDGAPDPRPPASQ
jgi:acetyl esterase/lipase